ncbi:uncharacterized protein DUF2865 [Aminobacter aminovorans]|uniref:Protein of uncharacterized function (DUF2865) n=1 Tax=Aminobacter aminovorans TaxID=83263 RepID=A0A380WN18_AMIAI|nr:uncharacterized protein DUF2865 [Aminobacter aminovorans]SUU89686.1 Protein of uncharacterised function (DUF2865) [Aminobacter aminovorans]
MHHFMLLQWRTHRAALRESGMFGRGRSKFPVKRPAIALLAAVAVSFLATGSSFAVTAQCLELETELASLPAQATGSFAQPDEFAAAAATQQDQIDLARIRASDLGCDRAISGDMIAQCAALNAKITEMQDNLGKLDGQSARPNRNVRRERIRILDAMQLAGCNDQGDEVEEATTNDPAPEQAGATIIRGGEATTLSFNESYPQHIVIGRNRQQGAGEYRTLCVRTCDGYFFPMSNAADLSDFQRDEKNCEASCPGTEIELFYHLHAGQPQESMVSARSGQPYRNLATAYRYKRVDLPRVPACGCNVSLNRNFSVIAGEGRPLPSAPQAKPVVTEPPAPAAPRHAPDPNRKVRAVGPTFLPDPQAAIDLRAPGPTPAR